jgi:hypothetical protein
MTSLILQPLSAIPSYLPHSSSIPLTIVFSEALNFCSAFNVRELVCYPWKLTITLYFNIGVVIQMPPVSGAKHFPYRLRFI